MLRKLEEKDIKYMLEWMHDDTINCNFQTDFSTFTYEKVLNFIGNSFTEENKHFAIVDKHDEYLGTISLKNISFENKSAEYAIVVRKKEHHKGTAKKATEEIIKYAFNELKLTKVYLNVLQENVGAIKFYEDNGFVMETNIIKHIDIKGISRNLLWYAIHKNV